MTRALLPPLSSLPFTCRSRLRLHLKRVVGAISIIVSQNDMTESDSVNPKTTDPLLGTSWAALQRTIREYDKEKVEFCRDDIDTLLVFVSPITILLASNWLILEYRLVFSRQFFLHSWSSRIRAYCQTRKRRLSFSSSGSPRKPQAMHFRGPI